MEHIKEHKAVLNELFRVLKKGGILIFSTPNKSVRSSDEENTNVFHKKELTVDEFKKLLNTHFSKFDLYSQRLIKNNGLGKKLVRNLVLKCIKYDSKKLYTKILPQSAYGIAYNAIDNTDGNYAPIPYMYRHNPLILIGIC